MKAGRELEKEAAHARTQEIGDMPEIPDQRLGAREPSHMRDEFRRFDGVDKFPPTRLANPSLNGTDRGP